MTFHHESSKIHISKNYQEKGIKCSYNKIVLKYITIYQQRFSNWGKSLQGNKADFGVDHSTAPLLMWGNVDLRGKVAPPSIIKYIFYHHRKHRTKS